MGIRRSREGSVFQRHDHPSCPPPTIDDDGRKTWPEHRCRGRWVAVVDRPTIAGKRRRWTRYAPTERDAKALRRQMLREVDAGRIGDDATVEQWCAHWLNQIAPETMAAKTIANHRGHVVHWIVPQLGRIRLDQLRPEDVRRFRAHLETATTAREITEQRPLSSTTQRYILGTLSQILRAAERERRILWNPAAAVPRPQISGDHHAHWATMEQVRNMIDAGRDEREQARFAVALLAGLRQGEALGLTWRDVDLDAGTIRVTQVARAVTGQGMVVTPGAKTPWSLRTVPMHPLVAQLLARHRATAGDPPATWFVFGGPEPMPQSVDYRAWRDGCRRAGLPYIPPHGARSTTAVLLRSMGVATSTIGDILGHKPGSAVTELSYAHSELPELEAAIRSM